MLTEKNNLLSQELEKCRTQLAVATAELEKSKKASPGNVPLHRENIIVYQQYQKLFVHPMAGSLDQLKEALQVAQEAKRQQAMGDRVLTRDMDEKNKLQDTNTLLAKN